MTDGEPPIEVGAAQDRDDVFALLGLVFHDSTEEREEAARATYEPERSLTVRDAGALIGHAGAYTRELTVPGAVVPAAHVSQVGVAPTHRRRGLLTRLMTRQLRDLRDAGREAIAVLWASESTIYPRFGYGMASHRLMLAIDNTRAGRPPTGADAGGLRMAAAGAFHEHLATLYERQRPRRPGWSGRNTTWWRRLLDDPPALREGNTSRKAVLFEGPDGVDGYALWRAKGGWDGWIPTGEVQVEEIVAATPEAYAALWNFLLSIDLTRTTNYPFASVDEPLQHLVPEVRQLRAQFLDGLWVRVVDVGAALASRCYATAVDVVLDVTDPLLPENTGRWRLTGDPSGARCAPTSHPPELACDVRDLGAILLGGPALGALVTAGRVRELRPGAAATASAAFGWHRAPSAIEIF
jgi:predicted acetyltransferase